MSGRLTAILILSLAIAAPVRAQRTHPVTTKSRTDSDIVRARVVLDEGNADSALIYASRASEVARSQNDPGLATAAARMMVVANIFLARFDVAAALARQALLSARAESDTSAETSLLIKLAQIAMLSGQPDSSSAYLWTLRSRQMSATDSAIVAALAQSVYAGLRTLGDRRAGAFVRTVGYDALRNTPHNALNREDMRDSARAEIQRVRQDMMTDRTPSRAAQFDRMGAMATDFLILAVPDSAIVYAERERLAAPPVFAASAQTHVALAEAMRATPAALNRAVALYDSALVAMVQTAPRAAGMRAQFEETATLIQRRVVQALLALGEPEAALAANDRSYLQRNSADLAAGDVTRVLARRGRALIERAASSGATHIVLAPLFEEMVTWTISPDGMLGITRNAVDLDWLASAPYALRSLLGVESGVEPDFSQVYLPSSGWRGGQAPTTASQLALQIAMALVPPQSAVLIPDSGELVVVGTGPIGLIPFAALPRTATANGDSTGSLLGDHLAIRILRALSDISSEPHVDDRVLATRNPLVMGDPLTGRAAEEVMWRTDGNAVTVHIPALPNARAEAVAISAMVGGRPLLGAAATRANFLKRIGNATLVHFAGHALASDANESLMYLQFAIDGDTAHTRLRARDIESPTVQPLHARLVTLSACESGVGEVRWTLGTLGLQRAFLDRGAATVLSSLWPVRDAATRILMETFYREWLFAPDKPDKAEALRRAQERVRAIPGYESPAYWAGWQLIGAQ